MQHTVNFHSETLFVYYNALYLHRKTKQYRTPQQVRDEAGQKAQIPPSPIGKHYKVI